MKLHTRRWKNACHFIIMYRVYIGRARVFLFGMHNGDEFVKCLNARARKESKANDY